MLVAVVTANTEVGTVSVDLVGALGLDTCISFEGAVLGSAVPVSIGGIDGSVLLPGVRWTPDGQPHMIGPRSACLDEEQMNRCFQDDDNSWTWGTVGSWTHERTITVAWVRKVVLLFPNVDADGLSYSEAIGRRGHPVGGVVKHLFSAIDAWTALVRSWAAVPCHQHTDPDHPVSSVRRPSKDLTVVTVEDGIVSTPATANEIIIALGEDGTAIDQSRWNLICELASAGTRPPVEYELLASARTARRRKETRRSVIDAATAAEIALRRMLADELRPLGEEAAQAVLKERRTLGSLVSLLQYRMLPEGLRDDLVARRNGAAHRNEIPTGAETDRAIQLAETIAEMVEALPDPKS